MEDLEDLENFANFKTFGTLEISFGNLLDRKKFEKLGKFHSFST